MLSRCCSVAATICAASNASMAIGFSHSTCFPASSAAIAYRACESGVDDTTTRSTSDDRANASPSLYARSPNSRAAASALERWPLATAVATKLCTAGIECEGMWNIAKDVPNRRVRAGSRNGVSQRRDPIKARRERIAKSQAREDTIALRTQSLQENRLPITAAVHCRRQCKAHRVFRGKGDHPLETSRLFDASRAGSDEQ